MKEYFGLDHLRYEDMSPVIVPRDYTKSFIDGSITSDAQQAAVREAVERVAARAELSFKIHVCVRRAGVVLDAPSKFRRRSRPARRPQVASTSDVTVLEGTGHVGVGSIIEASNADVAARLGADVVLVANGGIGSAFRGRAENYLLDACFCRVDGPRTCRGTGMPRGWSEDVSRHRRGMPRGSSEDASRRRVLPRGDFKRRQSFRQFGNTSAKQMKAPRPFGSHPERREMRGRLEVVGGGRRRRARVARVRRRVRVGQIRRPRELAQIMPLRCRLQRPVDGLR